jgi:hypothetical protein
VPRSAMTGMSIQEGEVGTAIAVSDE